MTDKPKTPKLPQALPPCPQAPKVDVQKTWRKFGWKPLEERKNDPSPSK